ncbi:TolC family protein [Fulvivirgaceae bacterium PWU4]|uniref:TolC family protein n=1 Tax=Chryseosolibacter histidini TaxID=2782349 RepID=A0AAP2DMV8_9BACT|nr:TolC family protein [Chryseosolibacter histidini]MBT1698027.1 TolC family protein [Chryseosolibacter histidini]
MKKHFFIPVILVALGFSGQAQEEKPLRLTYNEAIKIAMKSNVTLNQQKNFLLSSEVQRNQSIAAFLPSLGIQGSVNHTDGQQPSPETGDLEDLSVDNVSASLQAGVTIFNGFNRINTLNANINQFKAQAAFVKRSEQDVVFNVTNQYLQVLLDQELLKIAQESFKAQSVLLDQLKEQVRLGARAESDQYTQDAQVRNLELIALRAKVTLENDKALLAQTLQLDPAVPFDVELPRIDNSFNINGVSVDSLYAIAVANREDLKRADYQAKANLYAYKASINTYLPSLNASASYGSQYVSTLKPDPAYGTFSNQFRNVFPRLSYGVSLTIPIFDRLQTRNNRVFNKMTYENSKIVRDNVEKTIKIDVKRTYNNYLTAIESYEASQIQYQAGELALKTQQESFILGISAQVALAQANQTFVQAAASRAQAEITLVFQKMLLDYALGTLNPQSIIEQ